MECSDRKKTYVAKNVEKVNLERDRGENNSVLLIIRIIKSSTTIKWYLNRSFKLCKMSGLKTNATRYSKFTMHALVLAIESDSIR